MRVHPAESTIFAKFVWSRLNHNWLRNLGSAGRPHLVEKNLGLGRMKPNLGKNIWAERLNPNVG